MCKSVPITTKDVSSNSVHDELYSIQHYVIKFVSDLLQVYGLFLHQLNDRHDITEILLSGGKHHIPNQTIRMHRFRH